MFGCMVKGPFATSWNKCLTLRIELLTIEASWQGVLIPVRLAGGKSRIGELTICVWG